MVSSSRPRTPANGASSPPSKLAPIVENTEGKNTQRRSSLGMLLRRSKSQDLKGKKQQAAAREQAQREAAAIPAVPPRLPDLYNGAAPPKLQSFGGEDRPSSVAIISGRAGTHPNTRPSVESSHATARLAHIPIPPMPPNTAGSNGESVDPYARTESMTHRGRYSYASSAVSNVSSPRRVRRRKDPTPFK
jgi:hypothetical protein